MWDIERNARRRAGLTILHSLSEKRGLRVVTAEILNDGVRGPIYVEVQPGTMNPGRESIAGFDFCFQSSAPFLDHLPGQLPGMPGAILGYYLRPINGEALVRCRQTEQIAITLSGIDETWRAMTQKLWRLACLGLHKNLLNAKGAVRERLFRQLCQVSASYTGLCTLGVLPDIDHLEAPEQIRHLNGAWDNGNWERRLAVAEAYILGLETKAVSADLDLAKAVEAARYWYGKGIDCTLLPLSSIGGNVFIQGPGWAPKKAMI